MIIQSILVIFFLLSFLFSSLSVSFGDINMFHYQKPSGYFLVGTALLLLQFCLLFFNTTLRLLDLVYQLGFNQRNRTRKV